MTFSLLFSFALAQSPSDSSEAEVGSENTEETSNESVGDTESETETSNETEGDKDTKVTLPAEQSDSNSSESNTKVEAEPSVETEAKTNEPNGKELSLSSDFCPSGIKVPDLPNTSQKRELEKQWHKSNLSRYVDQSEYIFVGEIAGHRALMANQGRDMMVDVIVYDWLRGEEGAVISIHVPYNTPFIPGCPETVPPTVVDGYTMIFFVDKQKMVLEGNALYYLEAGYAWRNKRPDVFLSPRTDRDWIANDPAIDYVMYQLKDIRAAVDASNARRSFVAQANNNTVTETPDTERWWHFWK